MTTKIHAVVDGLGNPFYLQLSAGNVNDATIAVGVLTHVDISDSTVLADKAYGTKEILDYLQANDADYAIPPKSNARIPWRCDWSTYYDKLANSFLAFVYLAASFILLK